MKCFSFAPEKYFREAFLSLRTFATHFSRFVLSKAVSRSSVMYRRLKPKNSLYSTNED
jgi:hypothetical protein